MGQQAQHIYNLIKTLPQDEQKQVCRLLSQDTDSQIPINTSSSKPKKRLKKRIVTVEEAKYNLMKIFGLI